MEQYYTSDLGFSSSFKYYWLGNIILESLMPQLYAVGL